MAHRGKDYAEIVKRVKEIVHEIDPRARVYVFGSVARGEATAMSDIDVLVVTELANRKYDIMVNVYKTVEEPVELHVVTDELLNRWYRRFIPEEELIEI
ncbi:MAG: nucleotidyltransferase domain-containing protein [Nitrososphaerota archaeon]